MGFAKCLSFSLVRFQGEQWIPDFGPEHLKKKNVNIDLFSPQGINFFRFNHSILKEIIFSDNEKAFEIQKKSEEIRL